MAFLATGLGCNFASKSVLASAQEKIIIDHDLPNLLTSPVTALNFVFTFDVSYGNAWGKAFIANYKAYSAKHIFIRNDKRPFPPKGGDTIVIGSTAVHGLKVCDEKHETGDLFIAKLQHGYIGMYLFDETENYLDVSSFPRVVRGDSGSPAICATHSGVVGLVSTLGSSGGKRANRVWLSKINNVSIAAPKIEAK